MLDLVRSADVVVDNFRPGVMAKLGLDHESLAAVNPGIVTCSLTGFGETGPYARRPGYDYTIQALAGVMSMTGEPDGPPGKAGISYVDHSGGAGRGARRLRGAGGARAHGRGRRTSTSASSTCRSRCSATSPRGSSTRAPRRSGRRRARTRRWCRPRCSRPRDGHVSVFIGNDPMWARLVDAVGDDGLADPAYATTGGRLEHREAVLGHLSTAFRGRPSAEWVAALAERGVPCAPVNDLGAALADPQVEARGLLRTAAHAGYEGYRHVCGPLPDAGSGGEDRGAPLPGEHTEALLAELGYDEARIRRVLEDAALAP